MNRVLITGIGGFTGAHLARYLLEQKEQVFGFDRTITGLPSALAESVTLYSGDIRSQPTLKAVLAESRPETIYHLAGVLKATEVKEFYEINVLGTVALLEAVVESGISPRILITSSSAVYGQGFAGRPITEQFGLRPMTHYALSKAAQEAVACRYHRTHKLPVCCSRAFNLVGPGQPPALACSAFARQIAMAERTGGPGIIETVDLNAERDFTDVRDVVRAYALIAAFGKPGVAYNVCSQKAVSIRQCLELLREMARVPLSVHVDPSRLQPNDVPMQIGSAARLSTLTGWRPEITLQQSLADLLNYWRQELG